MKLLSAYDYDEFARNSRETGLVMPEEEGEFGKAQQHFKEESDINELVRRFGLTGEMPETVNVPQSGDFTEVVDYQTALNAVRKAEEGFMELPAHVRARFANDPQRLMEFMAEDGNRDEAIKLGLVNKAPEKTRDVVQAVDELAAKLTSQTK